MDPFEFADIAVGMLHRESETGSSEERTAVGIPQKVSGFAETDSADGYVMVDLGGSSVTEDDLQAVEMPTDVPVKAGDEVSVEIVDGKPRVVGRIGWGDALQTIADDAYSVATATNQHFWADANGAHVSTDANDPAGASNSLWNSLGLLIRKAANNLVSITQSAIAFYDGNGNNDGNILAFFGADGARVGKSDSSNVTIEPDALRFDNYQGIEVGAIESSGVSTSIACSKTLNAVAVNVPDSDTATFSVDNVNPTSSALGYFQVTTTVYLQSDQISDTWTYVFDSLPTDTDYRAGKLSIHMVLSNRTATFTATNNYGQLININRVIIRWNELAFAPMFRFGDGIASGTFAFSEGHGTAANGANSHAEGLGTIAGGQNQHAMGKYNASDSTSALIIGNGSDENNRSNAMTVGWDGAVAGLTFNGFRGRTNLASTDDIDALYTTGIYYIGSTGVGGTLPSGITAYFSLIAMGGGAETSSTYIGKQMILGGSGVVWTRSYSGSPRSWSAWAQLVSSSVATHSPTLTDATAVTFETRRQGSVVNLQVYQLRVAASLAEGSSVTLGTGIIGSNARPAHNVYLQLMSNTAGKGAGCFLVVTTAGNVVLYNRSGSALSTGTNLYGNTSWVI